MDQQFHSMVRY